MQHIGTWQVHGVVQTDVPIPPVKCLQHEISGEDLETEPATLGIHLMGTLEESGEMMHEEGSALVQDLAMAGLWDVTFNKSKSLTIHFSQILFIYIRIQLISFPLSINSNFLKNYAATYTGYVIYSDYVDYALYATCNDNGRIQALFMSRYHDVLSDTIVTNFKGVLEDYDVDVKNYVSVFHDHMTCGHRVRV